MCNVRCNPKPTINVSEMSLPEIVNRYCIANNISDYAEKHINDIPEILEAMTHKNLQIPVFSLESCYEKVNAVVLLSLKYVLGYGTGNHEYERLKRRLINMPRASGDLSIWKSIVDFWYERGEFEMLQPSIRDDIHILVKRDVKLWSKALLSAVFAFHMMYNDTAEELNVSIYKIVEVFPDGKPTCPKVLSNLLACDYFRGLKDAHPDDWGIDRYGYLVYVRKQYAT